MSEPTILLIPIPPSANRLWRNNHVSPEYRKWKELAGWEAKIQMLGVPTIEGAFSVKMEIPLGRRDLDNNVKAVLDLCQAVGAIQDDKFNMEMHIYKTEREGVLVELVAL